MKEKRAYGEKSLHPIAFWILLIAVIAGLCYGIYNMVIAIWALSIAEGFTNLGMFDSIFSSLNMPNIVDIFFKVLYCLVLFAFAIFILIYLVFILKLLKNKKGPASQKYLGPLFAIAIIGLIMAVISLFASNWVSIAGLIINVAIVVGIIIQNKYEPTNN